LSKKNPANPRLFRSITGEFPPDISPVPGLLFRLLFAWSFPAMTVSVIPNFPAWKAQFGVVTLYFKSRVMAFPGIMTTR
jgi:hypothetical protein